MSTRFRQFATALALGAVLLPLGAAAQELTEASITKFLTDIARMAIQYVLVVAAIFIMLSGYIYMTSFGNKGKVEQAKQMLLYTIIGILVVLGAYLTVNTVLRVVT